MTFVVAFIVSGFAALTVEATAVLVGPLAVLEAVALRCLEVAPEVFLRKNRAGATPLQAARSPAAARLLGPLEHRAKREAESEEDEAEAGQAPSMAPPKRLQEAATSTAAAGAASSGSSRPPGAPASGIAGTTSAAAKAPVRLVLPAKPGGLLGRLAGGGEADGGASEAVTAAATAAARQAAAAHHAPAKLPAEIEFEEERLRAVFAALPTLVPPAVPPEEAHMRQLPLTPEARAFTDLLTAMALGPGQGPAGPDARCPGAKEASPEAPADPELLEACQQVFKVVGQQPTANGAALAAAPWEVTLTAEALQVRRQMTRGAETCRAGASGTWLAADRDLVLSQMDRMQVEIRDELGETLRLRR
ncbi:hypothetical protein HYH03_013897 [Edaphochlamys debaryana]|uniref:Uncharacterized protein n=1 Tax=Edaphochlamys debaryana TaxID=47281 RepID=A0A835XV81_9CHLO|nr:hypothetical protein HYH03_013897 [Edaphochlamys debaryana]|eukprot:KAG2487475.1 hypothetical protein HYH03_013897 [Edaphochlamys debaryana]